MFEIKYSFSGNASSDSKKADEVDLRYNLFLGSLILKTQSNSIINDWEWVPLLDFAICIVTSCNNLLAKKQGDEEFEFTESDSKIFFHKNGDQAKIVTSFSDQILEMSFEELQEGVKVFYKSLLFEVAEENKEITDNTSFVEYLRVADKL